MKKILFAFMLTAGFGLAANAQSTTQPVDTKVEPVKVQSAGQVTSETPATEATVVAAPEAATPAKSCCSSKKGNDATASKSKSCCADGKKSKASCGDKKEEPTMSK